MSSRPRGRATGGCVAAVACCLLGCPGTGDPGIHDVQGRGAESPLAGRTVTVEGVVTAVLPDGFFVQAARPDWRRGTSEALFVRGGGVEVADLVRVTGAVVERRRTEQELSVTTLVAPLSPATDQQEPKEAKAEAEVEIVARGLSLPEAVPAPRRLRRPADAIRAWESLEGMRVALPPAEVVGARNGFGEIALLLPPSAADAPRTSRGGLLAQPGAERGDVLLLDDAATELPAARVGDRVGGPTVGVLDYRFGAFRLYPEVPPAIESAPPPPPAEPAEPAEPGAGGHVLSIASMNVENLDLGDAPARFMGLADLIAHGLRAPDLVALQEVQDDSGPADDGQVSSERTHRRLIDAIVAAGGPRYAFREVRPFDNQDGGEPGGNIRNSLLFRGDRVTFVDRSHGRGADGPIDARRREESAHVVTGADGPELVPSPSRIGLDLEAFTASRKPLAAELRVAGRPLWLINVHLRSKRGDDPILGAHQPPRQPSALERREQAAAIAKLVGAILTADADARVAVVGDFNDGVGSPATETLENAGLYDLGRDVPAADRYSFVYQGRSQLLDHVLVSRALRGPAPPGVSSRLQIVHRNADLPASEQLSDHDPLLACLQLGAEPAATDR